MINLKTGSHFRDLTKKEEMLTRRNVLTGLGGIIAAGCAPSIALGAVRVVSRDANAGSANASVGGMMRGVGGRLAARFGDGKPTARDYVQDGLRLHFDGIESGGYDSHSSSSMIDLIGGQCKFNGVVEDDYFVGGGKSNICSGIYNQIENNQIGTVEIVCDSNNANSVYFSTRKGGGEGEKGVFIAGWSNQFCFCSAGNGQGCNYLFGEKKSISISYTNGFLPLSNLFISGEEKPFDNYSQGVFSQVYSRSSFYISGIQYIPQKNNVYSIRVYNRKLGIDEIRENHEIDKHRFGIA